MLVLSRKIGERIVIGDEVRITVLDTRGRHIRLGIEAPETVPIFREELTCAEPGLSYETAALAGNSPQKGTLCDAYRKPRPLPR